jgi:hypothetical protein
MIQSIIHFPCHSIKDNQFNHNIANFKIIIIIYLTARGILNIAYSSTDIYIYIYKIRH